MLEQIKEFFNQLFSEKGKKTRKKEKNKNAGNKAKERLHIVLVQDRANISTDFLDLMKQEIIDVIKKYVVVDESKIDVRFTNSVNNDGTHSAPTLYANVPIINIRNEMKSQKLSEKEVKKQEKLEEKVEEALKKDEPFNAMIENTNKEVEKETKTDALNKALADAALKQREKNTKVVIEDKKLEKEKSKKTKNKTKTKAETKEKTALKEENEKVSQNTEKISIVIDKDDVKVEIKDE